MITSLVGFGIAAASGAATARVGKSILKTVGENKTWKDTSMRDSGPDGYQFGDFSRGVFNKVFGRKNRKVSSQQELPVALTVEPPTYTPSKLEKLRMELKAVNEQIDNLEDQDHLDEAEEAALTYLRLQKKKLRRLIKNITKPDQ